MFSALRQGSSVYILEKGSKVELKIGQVVSVTSPTTPYPYLTTSSTVDIVIKVDDQTQDFKQLPSQLSVATYNNGNTVISESRDLMCQEVETMIRNSRQVLDSIPYHEDLVKTGEEMLKQLSPQYAKQKDQEDKINNLETKVGGIESKIDSIYNILSNSLKDK